MRPTRRKSRRPPLVPRISRHQVIETEKGGVCTPPFELPGYTMLEQVSIPLSKFCLAKI